MKKLLRGITALLAASMLFCGCEMSESMKEDLTYIKEHAGQIGDLLGKIGDKIAEDPDAFFNGDGETEQDLFLEPLLDKTWVLCAIEDEYGYNDQIFEDEQKRFLLVDEWIQLHFSPFEAVGNQSGEVVIRYSDGSNETETHSYQYNRTESGLWLAYMWPDYDKYGQDSRYSAWQNWDAPEAEDWPFVLPLQDETWFLKYDETRGMIKIERTKNGADTPYMSWYLEGTPWYQ